MTQQTICELAILFLLLLSSSRIFFIKDPRSDPLAAIPLLAFIMSILDFFAWGINLLDIIVASVAFFVFLWNFRALLRLNENLIVDHYSFLFIFASCISIVLTILTCLVIIYFMPSKPDFKKYGVKKDSWQYTGDYESGFYDLEKPSDKKTVFLYKYEPKEQNSKKGTILFIPNECADSFIYEPIFAKLSHDGYTVYSADFYLKSESRLKYLSSKTLRKGSFIQMRKAKPEQYERWIAEEKNDYYSLLYKSLVKIVSPDINDFIILLGDCIDSNMFIKLQKEEERIDTCFDLRDIPGYDMDGYGPVEQTAPVIAYLHGKKKDSSMYASNHIATLLEKMIEQSFNLAVTSNEGLTEQ